MFLAGLFIAVPYFVSYLAFAITGKADHKLPIVMNSSHHLHSSHILLQWWETTYSQCSTLAHSTGISGISKCHHHVLSW